MGDQHALHILVPQTAAAQTFKLYWMGKYFESSEVFIHFLI